MPTSKRILALALLAGLASCDREGAEMLPQPVKDHPSVVEIGALKVLTLDEYAEYKQSEDPYGFCGSTGDDGALNCFYGQLGPPEGSQRGGATFTFTIPEAADGEDPVTEVCVMVDPETVFWNPFLIQDPVQRATTLTYPDFADDDGDLDLFSGMSAYYTGSPGIELGDFTGFYTDSLGRTLEIEFDECYEAGFSGSGLEKAHAGRGALEFCDMRVDGREGIEFTVVLDTFSVPLDDGALSFGAMVVAGPCRSNGDVGLDFNECTIKDESLDPAPPSLDDKLRRACSRTLEEASCASASLGSPNPAEGELPPLQEFCCANPEMCSDREPEDACRAFEVRYGGGEAGRTEFCAQKPELCCENEDELFPIED